MRLFYQDAKPDPEKIHKVVSRAYGTAHPEKVHGYSGAFLFWLPDVYVSDGIEAALESTPGLPDLLTQLLMRFKKDDYGVIPKLEEENNIENRYLGGGRWMIAAYNTEFGKIVFEVFLDLSMFYFETESVDDIRNAQLNGN